MTKTEKTVSALPVDEIEQFVMDAGSDHVPTFGGKFEGGIQCQQVPDEIAPCIHAILESGKKIGAYLEIGAAAGGTTFIIDHFFKPEKIFLIDDNRHPKHHVRPYILRDVTRTEIIGQSQAQGTVDVLQESIDGGFDMILIDGDHTYEGVSGDVGLYRAFLNPGGFMVFHDSALPSWGVGQAVSGLMSDPEFDFIGEFIGQKGNVCGVAVFQKKNAVAVIEDAFTEDDDQDETDQ